MRYQNVNDAALTTDQLREMANKPYWHVGLREDSLPPHWSILDPLLAYHPEDYDYGVAWLAYAYQPLHIDQEKWTAEWKRKYRSGAHAGGGYVCSKCDMWNNRPSWFCPSCGCAMTKEAWAELQKKLED